MYIFKGPKDWHFERLQAAIYNRWPFAHIVVLTPAATIGRAAWAEYVALDADVQWCLGKDTKKQSKTMTEGEEHKKKHLSKHKRIEPHFCYVFRVVLFKTSFVTTLCSSFKAGASFRIA